MFLKLFVKQIFFKGWHKYKFNLWKSFFPVLFLIIQISQAEIRFKWISI